MIIQDVTLNIGGRHHVKKIIMRKLKYEFIFISICNSCYGSGNERGGILNER